MQAKLFEIRDRGTTISAMAVKLESKNEAERWLLDRAGYGRTCEDQLEYVLLMNVDGAETRHVHYDPYAWGCGRTMMIAHQHIIAHFDELPSGSVVCVEFLSGERPFPKPTDAEPMIA